MIALLSLAFAAEPGERNLSATTIGAQYWQAPAVADSDVDVFLGQRLRWTLFDNGSTAARLRMNGRFTLSPGDAALWKRNRVTQLGVSLIGKRWRLEVGRSRVHKGGPRLVDGLQFIRRAGDALEVGAWAGVAPDLFTTEPRMRPGAGPIVAYSASRVQASVVGEVLLAGGGVDRAGALLQARASAARTVEVSGRLDIDLAGGGLSDGQVFARWTPTDTFAVDGLYNIFSSYRYQNTEDLDPDIQRFDARRVAAIDGFLPDVYQNCLDPGTAHLLGVDVRRRPSPDGSGLFAKMSVRYRLGSDVEPLDPAAPACQFDDINSFLRVSPRVGLMNLPVAGGLDLTLDANLYNIEGRQQADAGVSVYFEPTDEGVFAIDASYRMLFNAYDAEKNPYGYEGTGHYGDLFVDLIVVPADLMVGIGLNAESEPYVELNEVGIGAFARVTKYLRPARK